MFPVATMTAGDCVGVPDVCLTPVPPPVTQAPIPYPNTATLTQANPGLCSKKVRIQNQAVVLLGSQVTVSTGDEPGVKGGVTSSTIKGLATFKKGSVRLIVEGQPAMLHLGLTGQNGVSSNAPVGFIVSPSQFKVLAI